MNHGIVTEERSRGVPRATRRTQAQLREAREARYAQERAHREAEQVAEWDRMPRRHGLCYFVGFAGTGHNRLIKIGHSRQLGSRLSQLRSTCPWSLTLLATATGSCERERYYHARFAAHLEFGEWFRFAPEIEAEVARLAHPTPPHLA